MNASEEGASSCDAAMGEIQKKIFIWFWQISIPMLMTNYFGDGGGVGTMKQISSWFETLMFFTKLFNYLLYGLWRIRFYSGRFVAARSETFKSYELKG